MLSKIKIIRRKSKLSAFQIDYLMMTLLSNGDLILRGVCALGMLLPSSWANGLEEALPEKVAGVSGGPAVLFKALRCLRFWISEAPELMLVYH